MSSKVEVPRCHRRRGRWHWAGPNEVRFLPSLLVLFREFSCSHGLIPHVGSFVLLRFFFVAIPSHLLVFSLTVPFLSFSILCPWRGCKSMSLLLKRYPSPQCLRPCSSLFLGIPQPIVPEFIPKVCSFQTSLSETKLATSFLLNPLAR